MSDSSSDAHPSPAGLTVISLGRVLRRAGFRPVEETLGDWVYTDHVPEESGKRWYRRAARIGLLARLGIADLWAVGVRPKRAGT